MQRTMTTGVRASLRKNRVMRRIAFVVASRCANMGLASLAVASTYAPPLAAQDIEAERTKIYREGQKLADAGRWAEAAEKFRQVIKLRSAPKAIVALAFAEEKQKHLLEARELYRAAVAEANAAGLSKEFETARDSIGNVDAAIPRIVLGLESGVTLDQIKVDDKVVSVVGTTLEVDPGQHSVVLIARGYQPFSTSIVVNEGNRVTLQVKLVAADVAPQPASSASSQGSSSPRAPANPPTDASSSKSPEKRSPSRVGPIVVASAGVVFVAVGTALVVAARNDYDSALSLCGGSKACPKSVEPIVSPKIDDARDKVRTGDLAIGVGVAAVLGAGGWWWFQSRSASSSAGDSHESFRRPQRIAVDAVVTSTDRSITVQGSFLRDRASRTIPTRLRCDRATFSRAVELDTTHKARLC